MPPTESKFEAEFSMETEAIPVPDDPPFHILVSGDFSGRANLIRWTGAPLGVARPVEIDRDNLEEVMRSLNTGLRIEPGGEGTGVISLLFKGLDDFHPDTIFSKVPVFEELRGIRRRLLDPGEYDSAAREVRGWLDEVEPESIEAEETKKVDEGSVAGDDLLDDILGQTKRDADSYAAEGTEQTDVGRLVKELVKPHLVLTDEVEQEKLVGVVDALTSDLMRGIIHDPEFKQLEAAWRGLDFLCRQVETGRDLRIYVWNLSKEELADDLKKVDDLTESDYFSSVASGIDRGEGAEPWALICGIYDFELNVEDAAALIRLAKVSGVAAAPFISHIRPQMLGIRSLADNPVPSDWNLRDESEASKLWKMLRTVPEAVNLGLLLPRIMVRLPYGSDSDPTEAFNFEELSDQNNHDEYLWVNPSFAFGMLLAQSFKALGWEIGGRYLLNIQGLPTHIFQDDGETRTKPCAEITMTHEACDVLIEQGVMPMISFKETDKVRLGGVQSIAFPSKDLNGRWS